MGIVYFPKEGVTRIRAEKSLITQNGLGFLQAQVGLNKLVAASILRCAPCPSVTKDEQDMNSSYENVLAGLVEKQLDLKPVEPKPVVEEVKEPVVEEVKEPVVKEVVAKEATVEEVKDEPAKEKPKPESRAKRRRKAAKKKPD